MKLTLILFAIIGVLVIDARNVEDMLSEQTSDTDHNENFFNHVKEHATSQRHKRRSRQSPYFGYWNQYPNDNGRRDYDRQQDELLAQILRKLDEISTNMRTPPPPPQPVYVPYPVPYAVPRYTACRCRIRTNMTFDDRFPEMEDPRQNWGIVEYPGELYPLFEGDGTRPIYVKPVAPKQPVTNKPIKEPSSTEAQSNIPEDAPGECQAAILSCCSSKLQELCFSKYDCLKTFKTGIACRPDVIKSVINDFAEKYAPQN